MSRTIVCRCGRRRAANAYRMDHCRGCGARLVEPPPLAAEAQGVADGVLPDGCRYLVVVTTGRRWPLGEVPAGVVQLGRERGA